MAETNNNQTQQNQQAAQNQASAGGQQAAQGQQASQQAAQGQQGGQAFDFEKLATILEGRQRANEESVLKGYFKQQGITGEEAAPMKKDAKSRGLSTPVFLNVVYSPRYRPSTSVPEATETVIASPTK